MKRPLTDEEAELCKAGIKSRKETIKELEYELAYFEDFDAFNIKWKDYVEKKAEKEKEKKKTIIDQTRKFLTEEIASERASMKIEKAQLIHGVEVKEMPGVN